MTLRCGVSSAPPGAADGANLRLWHPWPKLYRPNTINLSAASETGTATLTCSTMAASGILLRPSSRPYGRGWPLAGAVVSVAFFVFLLILPKQPRLGLLPLAVLLVVVALAVVSCGGGSSGGGAGTNPGTTTGVYTFTITATPSSGSAQTTTVTVNVQ